MLMNKEQLIKELDILKRKLSKIEEEDVSSFLAGGEGEIKIIYGKITIIEKELESLDDQE